MEFQKSDQSHHNIKYPLFTYFKRGTEFPSQADVSNQLCA